MVTWEELFQFCMVITAVIALVLQASNNKKRQPPNFPQSNGYLFIIARGEPSYWQHPLHLYYTPDFRICQPPGFRAGRFCSVKDIHPEEGQQPFPAVVVHAAVLCQLAHKDAVGGHTAVPLGRVGAGLSVFQMAGRA